MSGFEVVGLILGIYPVIGNALKVYRATKRGGAPKRFLRSLEVEQVIFGEFVHNLLASELSEKDLALLRDEDPSDLEVWKSKDLLVNVGRRLGPKTSELVLATLRDINELLSNLRREVANITVDERGDFANYGRLQGRLHTLRHNLPQSSISQSLDELRACNGILQRLLCDRTIHSSTSPAAHTRQRIRYLRKDSSHAVDLYHALYGSFQCECAQPHLANLGTYRLSNDKDGPIRRTMGDDDGRFEILLSLGEEGFEDTDSMERAWSPSQTENGHVARSKRRMSSISIQEYAVSETSNTEQIIDDLCSFVRDFDGKRTILNASLSSLGPKEKNYRISTTAPPRPNTLCVHDFLAAHNLPLSREDRMGLALRLSHTVLQLYSTPWIDDNWTWRSFVFAKDGENSDGRYDTSRLFVARHFYSAAKIAEGSDSSDDAAQATLPFTWAEPILTRLGFALIELALGARFADLRAWKIPELKKLVSPNLNNDWMNAEILDRETARLLVESGFIRREEGQAYEDAVRACLEHQYIHKSIVRGLKSDGPSFQEDVEHCILAPLYGMWEKSWGYNQEIL